MKWTEEAKAFVRAHYNQPGWSTEAIAQRLSTPGSPCNRFMVIGKARRLGLAGSPHQPLNLDLPPQKCANRRCGAMFKPRRSDHLYCTVDCRALGRLDRLKERRKSQSSASSIPWSKPEMRPRVLRSHPPCKFEDDARAR